MLFISDMDGLTAETMTAKDIERKMAITRYVALIFQLKFFVYLKCLIRSLIK